MTGLLKIFKHRHRPKYKQEVWIPSYISGLYGLAYYDKFCRCGKFLRRELTSFGGAEKNKYGRYLPDPLEPYNKSENLYIDWPIDGKSAEEFRKSMGLSKDPPKFNPRPL